MSACGGVHAQERIEVDRSVDHNAADRPGEGAGSVDVDDRTAQCPAEFLTALAGDLEDSAEGSDRVRLSRAVGSGAEHHLWIESSARVGRADASGKSVM